MEEVDWFGAPDAEYWCDGQFFKIINGDWYCRTCHDTSWRRPAYASPENFSWWGNRVVRPIATEWNGNGLPPVGTVCLGKNSSMQWVPGTIVYIGKDHRDMLAIMQADTEILYGEIGEFRPIKTAEQIAAEERESHVNAMLCHDALGGTRRGLAEALYDAGYRKPKGTNQ